MPQPANKAGDEMRRLFYLLGLPHGSGCSQSMNRHAQRVNADHLDGGMMCALDLAGRCGLFLLLASHAGNARATVGERLWEGNELACCYMLYTKYS
jgi:hypothetical protein